MNQGIEKWHDVLNYDWQECFQMKDKLIHAIENGKL